MYIYIYTHVFWWYHVHVFIHIISYTLFIFVYIDIMCTLLFTWSLCIVTLILCTNQFRRRLDVPPRKGLPLWQQINIYYQFGGFVVDHKCIDVLTQYISFRHAYSISFFELAPPISYFRRGKTEIGRRGEIRNWQDFSPPPWFLNVIQPLNFLIRNFLIRKPGVPAG